jgi:murein DD-endopeptidase MepM/ murein hydrolase activator NlpD
MSKTLGKSGTPVRLAVIGVATMMLGGCADTGRGGDPFASPFQSTAGLDRSPTGSTVSPPQQQASNFFADAFKPFDDHPAPPPAASVSSAPPRAPRPAPIDSQPLTAPSASIPAPSVAYRPGVPAAPATALHNVPGGVGGWSAEGGTPVVVAQGESAETIAQRFGVPTATLLTLNGYANRAQVQPGARLVIPVYHANGARVAAAAPVAAPKLVAPVAAPPLAAPKALAPASLAKVQPAIRPDPATALAEQRARLAAEKAEASRKVAEAQAAKVAAATAAKVAKPGAPLAQADAAKAAKVKLQEAKAADAAKLAQAKAEQAQAAQLKAAQAKIAQAQAGQAKLEQAKSAQAKVEQGKPAQVDKKQIASAAPVVAAAPVAIAAAQPVASKFEKAPAPSAPAVDTSSTASLQPAGGAASDSANPEFRWPARGRVIQAFGAGGNDGINIAVPEGTQVKASEGGVVAYAGSELKGYGNLVLIRHPNGFVSAYANNGSLNVKRGDAVKRGQTIALSGQSGNVASPQLHFELRKGSKPVDPSTYLAGL